ncbi:MAG: glycosyl transferase family 2 [Solirubrobacterales bacterium]|nr:glycosyl transferase family 2 [Solirubrobacterales bacterium]
MIDVSVVVASHERPLRLRWLLHALEAQTLPMSRWELVVVFDDVGEEAADALRDHPLAARGVLRAIRLEPGTGTPARQRNTGWRAARGPLVAFTDDDCRPAPEWLAALLAAGAVRPGDVVQGRTRPDPFEAAVALAPRVRTLDVDPPVRELPTCNVAYRRVHLEAVGGFDERLPAPAGEDTDLAERVRAVTDAGIAPAPDAVVFHAVESYGFAAMARVTWKWRHIPFVTKRHPQLMEDAALGIFFKHAHWRLLVAGFGLLLASRTRGLSVALVLVYLRHALLVHGRRPAGVLRATAELPSRAALDLVELAAVARGSLEHRTLLL